VTDLGDRHPTGQGDTAEHATEARSEAPPEAWDGDQSRWSDELHIPYVPRRAVDDEQDRWDEPPPAPSKDDLRYRPAPAGSSRRDRTEWRQAEGERIADLLATVEHPRKAGLRVSAPRGLGRRGRKAFYATRSENVQARRRHQAGNLSERELGILALVIVIALAVLVRVVFFGDSTPQPTPTDPAASEPAAATVTWAPSSPTVSASAAAPGAAAVDPAAVAAATAWFTVTCPLPPSAWAPVQALMTPTAWAAVDTTPPVVTATWSCTNLNVRAAPDQQAAPQGGVIVRMNADRTITTGTTPTVTENTATVRVVVNSGGRWLIDREPAN
jgi:cytoskeletal protein RodZ